MFKNNAKKITALESRVSGAIKIFNDTLSELRKSLEGYNNIKVSVQNEIDDLEETKADVIGKIESTSTLIKKFENLLSC